jgi:hypothetical protein
MSGLADTRRRRRRKAVKYRARVRAEHGVSIAYGGIKVRDKEGLELKCHTKR